MAKNIAWIAVVGALAIGEFRHQLLANGYTGSRIFEHPLPDRGWLFYETIPGALTENHPET